MVLISNRFSEPGNEIFTTAADKDDMAALAIGQGRTLPAFVSDPAQESVVAGQVKAACSLALVRRWFPKNIQTPRMVGLGVTPSRVPSTNVSEAISREITAHAEENMDYDDGCDNNEGFDLAAHQSVAVKLAVMTGIESKVSTTILLTLHFRRGDV